MNKLAIPTILAAIVLIAGIFAFMPINNATTVHDTIIGTQLALKIEEDSGTGITDGDRIVFDCDKDFTVREILFTFTNLDRIDNENSERIDVGNNDGPGGETNFPFIVIDGVPLVDNFGQFEDESFAFGAEFPDADPTFSWTGFIDTEAEPDEPFILFAEGEGTDDIVINLFDDGTDPLDGDEELTVKALFVTESDAVCTVDVDT